MFITWKNKINCQGKMVICQGNVREFGTNSNVAPLIVTVLSGAQRSMVY